MCAVEQSRAIRPLLLERAALPDRFYTQLQVLGLHAWLVLARLHAEPRESYMTLRTEMMEKIWDQCALDLSKDFGFGYIEMSKHLKESQFSWHGICKSLDESLTTEAPREAIGEVLLRNLYVDEEGNALVDATGSTPTDVRSGALWLADYILAQRAHMAGLESAAVLKGRITWAPADAASCQA